MGRLRSLPVLCGHRRLGEGPGERLGERSRSRHRRAAVLHNFHNFDGSKSLLVSRSTYAGSLPAIAQENNPMTTPHERTRALLWTGAFLKEVALDHRLPIDLRQQAVVLARHYPTLGDVHHLAVMAGASGFGEPLARPDEVPGWEDGCRHGPLLDSTRLPWPMDPDE